MQCESNNTTVVTLSNQTGATATSSVVVVAGTVAPSVFGHTVAPGADLFTTTNSAAGEVHLLAQWASRAADITIGWYFDSSTSKCTVLAQGVIR
jgi:hypothetical protein